MAQTTANQGAAGATPWLIAGATYTAPAIAQVTSGTSVAQFASVACKLVRIKALAANTGKCYVGTTGVAATSGFELAAGDDTGWIPVDNLNRLYHIADTASQKLCYMVLV